MFQPFEDLKPTTMTVCMELSSDVVLGNLFTCLPILKVPDDILSRTKKDEYPLMPETGIISAKFMGNIKGVKRIKLTKKSKEKKGNGSGCFKNAITLTISIGMRNVSVKIYRGKLHICGSTSDEMSLFVGNNVLSVIHSVREISSYCKKNPELIDLFSFKDSEMIIRDGKFFTIKKEMRQILKDARECLDKEGFYIFLSWLKNGPEICDENLTVKSVEKAMVNYNYSIGFRIIKPLVEEVLDGVDGFTCRYNPKRSFVTISLPYEISNQFIKKKKKTRHTFMLYNTGCVTQSGPNEDLMKPAYEKFRLIMLKIREKVMCGTSFIIYTGKHHHPKESFDILSKEPEDEDPKDE